MARSIDGEKEKMKKIFKGFIKFARYREDFLFLLRHRPTAFALLALIALRAKRTNDHPDPTLEIGEAFIGDYKTYGATERSYRTDKNWLKTRGITTFRTTSKGTIAKLVKSTIFDINADTTDNPIDRLSTSNNKGIKNVIQEAEQKFFTRGEPSIIGSGLSLAEIKQLPDNKLLSMISRFATTPVDDRLISEATRRGLNLIWN